MILIICMRFSLAGCGGRDVGGIGSIDMDDEGSGGVGILGEPGDTGDDATNGVPNTHGTDTHGTTENA